MRRALGPCLLLAGLLLAGSGAEAAEDPHRVLSGRAQCQRCHVEVPRRGAPRVALRFRRDIVSLCLDCHREKELAELHPVDIRPGPRGTGGLPLDEHGAITCATCHDPHGPHEASEPFVAESLSQRFLSVFTGKNRNRTFYLRRRNDKGQLCLTCHDKDLMAAEGFHVKEASLLDQYTGSESCKPCHKSAYEAWRRTPHARMARDARKNPGAVLADFEHDPPFPRDQVIYALGSHWTQRYVVERGSKLYVKAAVWNVGQKKWDKSNTVDKPWAQYCQGCHTTGFEAKTEPRFAELGIGCEACHGPGRAHVTGRGKGPIVNPAKLDEESRTMICESCHTSGHDRTGQFRFPLGYLPGKDLTRYYKGLLPKAGQDNATFFGDESYADRRRQWLFWVKGFMDVRDANCDVCKNIRGKPAEAKAKPQMTVSDYCLSCHRDDLPATDVHRRHDRGVVQCHQCHVPSASRSRREYSVHDHKMLFGPPEVRETVSPRAACVRCHKRPAAKVSSAPRRAAAREAAASR